MTNFTKFKILFSVMTAVGGTMLLLCNRVEEIEADQFIKTFDAIAADHKKGKENDN